MYPYLYFDKYIVICIVCYVYNILILHYERLRMCARRIVIVDI